MDGPVVVAARRALEAVDVDEVLPYVHADGEAEVRDAFDRALEVRSLSDEAREVADRWFFETAVRVHRAGEGAPFTGLKPSGLDVGPVIPAAERALATGSADELVDVLCSAVRSEVSKRHSAAMALKARAHDGVTAAREYVESALGLQVWSHHVYRQVMSGPHSHGAAKK